MTMRRVPAMHRPPCHILLVTVQRAPTSSSAHKSNSGDMSPSSPVRRLYFDTTNSSDRTHYVVDGGMQSPPSTVAPSTPRTSCTALATHADRSVSRMDRTDGVGWDGVISPRSTTRSNSRPYAAESQFPRHRPGNRHKPPRTKVPASGQKSPENSYPGQKPHRSTLPWDKSPPGTQISNLVKCIQWILRHQQLV